MSETKELRKPIYILMADDDEDDRELALDALKESRIMDCMRFVGDGEELMDYLKHRGKYQDPASAPRPGIILLDLNMPRKDGREALREIKDDPELKSIPVVILTTSDADADIIKTYNLGANSYIVKPVTFAGLVEVMRIIGVYWFQIVELASQCGSLDAGTAS